MTKILDVFGEDYSNEYYNSVFESKPKIGIEPKQWEFECPCGHIWIDCENTGCPMCGEEVGITAKPYDIKQPNRSAKHNWKTNNDGIGWNSGKEPK